jgi:Methyltransferase domain
MHTLDSRRSLARSRALNGSDAGSGFSWIDTLAALSDPSLDPLFWHAERLGSPSAWWQHVPFAHWLVCAAAPRVLVELGTHTGVSYFAFCQGVVRGRLATRCHAVDTWRGDLQTGNYGPEVLDELRWFHDERIGAFSTLLQCTFDEALDRFEEGTVDLLHVDGLHTYQAVRHDFESWLPKLSSKAVVLFHDVNERTGDFGVWRLWGELQRQYPSFEFLHGHGLGVLAVGKETPGPVAALCELAEPTTIMMIQTRFARLGERWSLDTRERIRLQEVGQLKAEASQLHAEVARYQSVADQLRAETTQHCSAAARLRADLAQRTAEVEQLRAEIAQRAAEVDQLRAEVAEHRSAADQLCADLTAHREGAGRAAELEALYASTSWQITRPLRYCARLLPTGTRHLMRCGLRVCWRAATGRLSRRALDREMPSKVGIADAPPSEKNSPARADILLRQHFAYLEPLRVFPVTGQPRNVTMVTDGIGPHQLFGGVGTALVFSTLLAQRLNARLRLVTRTDPADAGTFGALLSANGISWNSGLEILHSSPHGGQDVPVGDEEIFVTTSWWTTRSVLGSVPPEHIIYLLQEDERMFYPFGDERLRCAETLAEPAIRFVINTKMLFDHLVNGTEPLSNLTDRAVWFEPAFPAVERATRRPRIGNGRYRFFFYARPNNPRNLYWRGLEAIVASVEDGMLDPATWDIYFVGRDLADMELPRRMRPHIAQTLSWRDYAQLVRTMDVGLSLVDTPHPSYPPLDLALGGAIVVTNRHGTKTSLEHYAEDVLCVEPSVAGLRCGIAEAVTRAANPARLRGAVRLGISWKEALEPALVSLFPLQTEQ